MSVYTVIDPAAPLVFGPFAAGSVPATRGASGTLTVTAPGAGVFVWPEGIDRVRVQCWAAGGGGGGGAAADRAGGGAGGAYAESTVLGVPGVSYPFVVGAGGVGGVAGGAGHTGGPGGNTTYRGTMIVAQGALEQGGFDEGGQPGTAADSTGSIKWDGGGGAGQGASTGGGGGSSAGTEAAGNAAGAAPAGGVAPAGGGAGGAGGNAAAGAAGSIPGGGGGGGDDNFPGGAGAAGKIVFTW